MKIFNFIHYFFRTFKISFFKETFTNTRDFLINTMVSHFPMCTPINLSNIFLITIKLSSWAYPSYRDDVQRPTETRKVEKLNCCTLLLTVSATMITMHGYRIFFLSAAHAFCGSNEILLRMLLTFCWFSLTWVCCCS